MDKMNVDQEVATLLQLAEQLRQAQSWLDRARQEFEAAQERVNDLRGKILSRTTDLVAL